MDTAPRGWVLDWSGVWTEVKVTGVEDEDECWAGHLDDVDLLLLLVNT